MKQVLYWIGYRVAASQKALIDDAFGLFNGGRVLMEKDINTMASNFSSRTQTNGSMNVGTGKIKIQNNFPLGTGFLPCLRPNLNCLLIRGYIQT